MPVYVILTDECFDREHERCSGNLPDGYWGAECGCDCHAQTAGMSEGAQWAEFQSETEAADGDQVV